MSRVLKGGLFSLVLAACGHPPVVSAPAPAGALECAVAHSLAAGYEVVEGKVEDGRVRLTRGIPTPGGTGSQGVDTPDLSDVVLARQPEAPAEDQVIFQYRDGRLEMIAVSDVEKDLDPSPRPTPEAQPATILTVCAADPEAVPRGAPPASPGAGNRPR